MTGIFVRADKKLLMELERLSRRHKKTKSEIIREAIRTLSRKEAIMTKAMRGIIKIPLKEVENVIEEGVPEQ